MIAKRIQRKGASSFKKLGAYVLAAKEHGKGDPTGWELGDYILDTAHAGEKVAWARVTNCVSDEPGWAVKEILATQAQNKRSKGDKTYHLVVSFPEGEKPTREQLEDIEDEVCRAIGLGHHQRISAVHQNTENWHLHVAINKVDPKTLRNVEPFYDHYRLQEACEAMEIKHNLTRDNHSPSPEKPINGRPAEMEAHAKRISFSRWVKENASPALTRAATEAQTWGELHAECAKFGLVIKPRGAGLIIAHWKDDRIRVKASDIDRSLSFKKLTDRLGDYEPPTLPAQEQEQEQPATPMPAGPAPQGRDPATPLPSPETRQPTPAIEYTGGPLHATPEEDSLWQRYIRERDTARDRRTRAMDQLRSGHLIYFNEMRGWYRDRYQATRKAKLNRGDRIYAYRYLKEQRKKDDELRRKREKTERAIIRDQYKVPTWIGFLERETIAGNIDARKALERTVQKRMISVETEIRQEHHVSVKPEQMMRVPRDRSAEQAR